MASIFLNEQGLNANWMERQLAHAEPNEVRAAYNAAQYLTERRRMMQAWADYLDALTRKGKVLEFTVVQAKQKQCQNGVIDTVEIGFMATRLAGSSPKVSNGGGKTWPISPAAQTAITCSTRQPIWSQRRFRGDIPRKPGSGPQSGPSASPIYREGRHPKPCTERDVRG
jgi:hypothetical protein